MVLILAVAFVAFYGIYLGIKALFGSHQEPEVQLPPDFAPWETLPGDLFMADFKLAPGAHDIRVSGVNYIGEPLFRKDFPNVTIVAGQTTVLRARCPI